MEADIVAQMRKEERDLARKLDAVRTFLAAYGEEVPQDNLVSLSAKENRKAKPRRSKSVPITSFTESTRTSVALSLSILANSDGLVRTADLVQTIETMGHRINGDNKVNSLGALLSRSEDVEGHGKSGWTVYDRENALALARKHAGRYLGEEPQKEKEPTSENTGGSDAGQGSVAAQPLPWRQPSDQSAYS